MNNVEKVIEIALNEVGYLEKSRTAYNKNPDIIYEKTAGAGQDNITKYGFEMHNLYPSIMDFPAFWCDSWVDWCFYKAYGICTAKSLLGGDFNDYTVASCGMYQKHDALYTYPKKGDQVFFTRNGKPSGCYHTGLVYDVDNTFFYTVEGNTSNASSVIPNGGGVARKKYALSQMKGKTLFGRPKYDVPKKNLSEVVEAVLRGEYGDGATRRAKLTDEGWNYSIVQAEVTKVYKERNLQAIKNDTPRYIWTYLMDKIKNPFGVAGLMGNLKAESGLNSRNLQNSAEKKLGMDDATYTVSVDNNAYTRFTTDNFGYGLAQWTSSGRKKALYDMRNNRSIGDLDLQLEFLMYELSTTYKSVLNVLKNANSIKQASDCVLTKFERPKDQSDAVKAKRANYGLEFYNKYGGN